MRDMAATLNGDGSNTRNFLFVSDAANSFDKVLHKGESRLVYCIGGDNETSNVDVARTLIHIIKGQDEYDSKWISSVLYPTARAKTRKRRE